MDRCIGESWVRWWHGSVEIGGLPMLLMMGRSRSLMMGWMWFDVGGVGGSVDLVASWVKWFHQSRFCAFADLDFMWVLCVFCNEAWIDFYLLGLDGLDMAVIWWFFFFFPLNLGFCFRWDFGGQWAWWCGRHGGGGAVIIGLFGC